MAAGNIAFFTDPGQLACADVDDAMPALARFADPVASARRTPMQRLAGAMHGAHPAQPERRAEGGPETVVVIPAEDRIEADHRVAVVDDIPRLQVGNRDTQRVLAIED